LDHILHSLSLLHPGAQLVVLNSPAGQSLVGGVGRLGPVDVEKLSHPTLELGADVHVLRDNPVSPGGSLDAKDGSIIGVGILDWIELLRDLRQHLGPGLSPGVVVVHGLNIRSLSPLLLHEGAEEPF